MHGVGVDERDLEPEQAPPRPLVDQLCALRRELPDRFAHVLDLVRDVMHSGAALGQELAHRRVRPQGAQQLDATGADPQRRRLDALVGNGLAMLNLGPEEPLVGRDRLVEVLDGYA